MPSFLHLFICWLSVQINWRAVVYNPNFKHKTLRNLCLNYVPKNFLLDIRGTLAEKHERWNDMQNLSSHFQVDFYWAWTEQNFFVLQIRMQGKLYIADQGSISSTCLQTAFTQADPECAKSCLIWMSFFDLLVSVHVKAARKMLMKLRPGS